MNISLNWLRKYIETDLDANRISELLTDIGLEVESVEKIESVKGGLAGIVIGEVLEKEKHPDADRLNITKVNVGTGEPLQIVCGAANVAAGQKVVVALEGAQLYPVTGESFKIKKSKIRGVESCGMICAEDEIGLGTSHDGIIVLDPSSVPGTPAAEYFKLQDDYLFSIGLTPNRIDAASHYGVARDLYAAIIQRGGKVELKRASVDAFRETQGTTIEVEVKDIENCLRYAGVSVSGIVVKASPEWLQQALRTIGLRPVNNIVDITNFVLHETGQPLHAFDSDKISGQKISVRKSTAGTLFKTLDGTDRKMNGTELMICDTQKEMCIAGVFGGLDSGVSENTTEIFIESAYFNPVSVRKTARAHGLNTDSSFRFERGVDPDNIIYALKRAALLILEIAGGKISSSISDWYPNPVEPSKVILNLDRFTKLIGKVLPNKEIASILTSLDINITKQVDQDVYLLVPAYRVDVKREADVVEEVLRIYGYNNIEIPAKINASLNHSVQPDPEKIQNQVADLLSANGFNEILSNSLTRSEYSRIADSKIINENWNVAMLNPLSSELDVLRQSLLFSGLEAILYNKNRQNHDLKFYEFGKIYFKRNDKYEENYRLSVFLTGRKQPENWKADQSGLDFYTMKSTVDLVLKRLGLSPAVKSGAHQSGLLEDGLSYEIAKKQIVEFGWVKSSLLKKMDIRQPVFYADFNWDNLLAVLHLNKVKYKEVPKFPSVRRDLSLLLNKTVSFAEIEQLARQTEKKLLKEVGLFDVYEGKNLDADKKSYAVSFVLRDDEQTLTDGVIDQVMEKIRTTLEEKLGAQLR